MNNQDVVKIAYAMGANELACILQDKYLNLEDLTINIPLEELKKYFMKGLIYMKDLAVKFAKQHRGKGKVVKITSYCFWWETLPDKNGNTKTTVYMKSYFM